MSYSGRLGARGGANRHTSSQARGVMPKLAMHFVTRDGGIRDERMNDVLYPPDVPCSN